MKKIKHKKYEHKNTVPENYTPKKIINDKKLFRTCKKIKGLLIAKGLESCFDTLMKMKENE